MNEAETRAEHIDPAIKAAGWGDVAGSRVQREFQIAPGQLQGNGRRGKTEIADYVLVYKNTKLAVIEAKAWDKPLTEGVGQAKQYAEKMSIRFTYATNGQGVYEIDMESGAEAEVNGFPSPEDLWQRTFAEENTWRDRFAAVPYEDKGGSHSSRYYQDTAISRVLEAISQGRNRILLTLATGTGKTFIAFQIAWKLFQSRWSLAGDASRRPRILFLADRNILADQAYTAFSAFPEDALVRIKPGDISKKGRVPKNGSIFFTIFQTFMSGPPKDGQPSPYFGEYPPDFFDFIIIDECHRGGASDESTWRAILEYFSPAVQLGLTATPKRKDNVDTYAYFGEPVYVYSLRDGINDGFLTPFRLKQISTTIDEYVYTADDEVLQGDVEEGKRYVESDFNKVIEIKAREEHRVKLFLELIDQSQKTLVFCATQEHALAVRDLINQHKTSANPNYCVRVTANDGEIGEKHLRAFQDNEKTIPTVLTTSQKLSTGVDARNVRNIVLMRPVNSMIEFKQIIGRGTRLFDGKDYFTIYDFVRAHEHFNDPEWDGEPEPPESVSVRGIGDEEGEADATDHEPDDQPEGEPRPERIKVRLADGKERAIQSMVATSFWSPNGRPMSSAQFLESLFGTLPEFFKDEAELRRIWSDPETRHQLLGQLEAKGFGRDHMAEMQRIIAAENSDLFDVLAFVAFALPPVTRQVRAAHAKAEVDERLEDKQRAFVEFVLGQYVAEGVDELQLEKLPALLRLKYGGAIADAIAELGSPEDIRRMFAEFQRFLYQEAV
jgi:type I restriction enzyme R subunit